MRFLARHGACLAQIKPRGIRHLLDIYMLSRECGVDIGTDHLPYLTDFRVRGQSDELKHTVTNASRMAVIAKFPSKDDHIENRFFFVEISEKTVEADCIDLVKTRWERRGRARVSSLEQAALEAAAKAARSSGTDAPRAVVPMTSTPMASSAHVRPARPLAPKTHAASTLLPPLFLTPDKLAMPHRQSEKGIDSGTSSKKQRVDTHLGVVVEREVSASRVAAPPASGMFRDEAYVETKSKASVLSLLFDRLVGDYDEDVCLRDNKLCVAKEANGVLQSRLDELTEQNLVLERDAFSGQKIKKDYDTKLAKLQSRCTKGDEEIASLKTQLSSAGDLQSVRISKAVTEARDEMTGGFSGQLSEVARLLAEISGKVPNNMLNLAKIKANLEFTGLHHVSEPPNLPTEIEAL
ncbi:hypothetical protein AALP_AA2G048800 [Arabis alpina]|uniref:Uncharacterized protein n=1 Tax=Arabis alpina TaxID=50452 RepID=A0A087HFE0_ARAAL|nr:hypothetical protein AALP_AA2G048800 [Arabis alpina]